GSGSSTTSSAFSNASFGVSPPSSGGIAVPLWRPGNRNSLTSCKASNAIVGSLSARGRAGDGWGTGTDRLGGRVVELDPADAVVLQATDVEVAVVFPHRRDRGVGRAARIPQRLEHFAVLGHLHHAPVVHARVEPLVARDAFHHPAAEHRHPHGQV